MKKNADFKADKPFKTRSWENDLSIKISDVS
jgi:hypothetical protein